MRAIAKTEGPAPASRRAATSAPMRADSTARYMP